MPRFLDVRDGMSGDTDFPHGPLKAIATVGERSTCDDSLGEKIVGVPDGLGVYLVDDDMYELSSSQSLTDRLFMSLIPTQSMMVLPPLVARTSNTLTTIGMQ
jgi:hypothetical protein